MHRYKLYLLIFYFHLSTFMGIIFFNFSSCSKEEKNKNNCPNMKSSQSNSDIRTVTGDSVVFLGDSYSDFGVWKKFFPYVQTANQGIGGNTSAAVLMRLDEILIYQPKKIFLLIGTNDIIHFIKIEATLNNIEQIIIKILAQSPNTTLYMQSVFPLGERLSIYKNQIPKLNQGLMNLSSTYNLTYINLYQKLADSENNTKTEYVCDDHTHLTSQGYKVWIEQIKQFVYH